MISVRPLLFAFVVLVVAVAALPVQAGRVRGTAVGVLFRDDAADMMTSDAIGGVDTSFEYINGVEGVKATYDSAGVLTISCGSFRPSEFERGIYMDFASEAATGMDGSTSPVHGQSFLTRVTDITVTVLNVSGGFDGMAVNSTASATLTCDFSLQRDERWFRFDNGMYPASANVTVTRTSATTWTVSASATDVADLLAPPTKRGTMSTSLGYYYMPFEFTMRTL